VLAVALSRPSPSDFWAEATATAAVLTLVMSVVLWYIGAPRRLIIYGVVSDTPLLDNEAWAHVTPDLQVTLNGQPVHDPHVVSVAAASRGRSDIRTSDFEKNKALIFDIGTPVLKLLRCDTGGAAMPEVQVNVDGSTVIIEPGLINRRQVISLDLLTDGPATLSCKNPTLANVTVRDGSDDDVQPQWSVWAGRIMFILLAPAFIVSGLTINTHAAAHQVAIDVIYIVFVAYIVEAATLLTRMAVQQGGLIAVRPWTRRVR
jgi:hypothetical protein